jgi:hypothetical protein
VSWPPPEPSCYFSKFNADHRIQTVFEKEYLENSPAIQKAGLKPDFRKKK